MKNSQRFFKAITIASTSLLLILAGCALDEPIDYTTGGYGAPSPDKSGGSYSPIISGVASRIGTGHDHTCAITVDDSLQCWGSTNPSTVPSDLGPVSSVRGGQSHTCAVKSDSNVVCWGDNGVGQSTVPSDLGTVLSITAGAWGNHTCAVKTDNNVACWGDDMVGQSSVPLDLGPVSSVSAGTQHTCAVKTNGSPVCWGTGVGTAIPADLGLVSSIGTGWNNTCAMKVDGSVVCWGEYMGSVPSDLGQVSSLSTGETHSCAVKADSSLACWGGDSGAANVPSDLGQVNGVSAGGHHTCAVKVDGSLACWGMDSNGQSTVPAELLVGSGSNGDSSNSLGVYDTTAPNAVSVVIDGGAESFTSSAGPTCVYYAAELNNITGGFSGSWYPSSESGVPTSTTMTADDDNDQDTIPTNFPEGAGFTLSGTYDLALNWGGTATANILVGPAGCGSTVAQVNLTLSATDDQAVTGYYASESTVTPQAGENGWDNYSTSVSYSFDNNTAETKTVNVWFKDAAGNVSGSVADAIELLAINSSIECNYYYKDAGVVSGWVPASVDNSTGTNIVANDSSRSAIIDATVTGPNSWTDNAALASYVNGGSGYIWGIEVDLIKAAESCNG